MATAKKADCDQPGPGLRVLRLIVPDPNSEEVRRRVAESSARLSPEAERDAMKWIEAVSLFDEPDGDRD